jgi:hypothetical protein
LRRLLSDALVDDDGAVQNASADGMAVGIAQT